MNTVNPQEVPQVSEIEQVTEHVINNTVEARKGRKCVDGGYTQDQSPGMIARPGADLGYILILLALNRTKNLGLSAKDCFEKVFNATVNLEGTFYMHTDHHSENGHSHNGQNPPLIGCGHAFKATLVGNSEAYGVNPFEAHEVVEYAKKRAHEDPRIVNIILVREHEENGILRVNSTKQTVRPWDRQRKSMYFVYDQKRDDNFMSILVPQLRIGQISLENFKTVSDQQLMETLKGLALGKSIFDINVDGPLRLSRASPQPQIAYAGKVE